MPSTSKKSKTIEHPPNYKIREENESTSVNGKISRTNSLENKNKTADTTRNIVPHLEEHPYSIQVFDNEIDETDTNSDDGISNLSNAEEIKDIEENHSHNDDELVNNDEQINDENQVLDPEIVLPFEHVNGEMCDCNKLIRHQLNQFQQR